MSNQRSAARLGYGVGADVGIHRNSFPSKDDDDDTNRDAFRIRIIISGFQTDRARGSRKARAEKNGRGFRPGPPFSAFQRYFSLFPGKQFPDPVIYFPVSPLREFIVTC